MGGRVLSWAQPGIALNRPGTGVGFASSRSHEFPPERYFRPRLPTLRFPRILPRMAKRADG
jgi:hypothetical protein